MARLKFLLFAIPVLALMVGNLFAVSPEWGKRAVLEAKTRTALAPPLLAEVVLQRRVELQRLAIRASASAPAAALSQNPRLTPALDKVTALADLVRDAAPEPLRKSLVVGVINEGGSAYVHGDAEATAEASAFDLKTVAEAGSDGLALDAFGASHLFYSTALTVPAGAEPRVVERVVLGAPLLEPTVAEEVLGKAGLAAIALVEGGRVLQAAGPDKGGLDKLVKDLRPGVAEVTSRGAAASMGPMRLPVLTQGDAMGGQAPLAWAFREAIPTTPYEVIAVTDLTPGMASIASYQRKSLAALGGLLVLTIVWTVLMGSGAPATDDEEEESTEEGESAGAAPPQTQPGIPAPEPASTLAMQDVAPPPEASPEDFPFGQAPAPSMPEMGTVPAMRSPLADKPPDYPPPPSELFSPPPEMGATPSAESNPFDFENQPTRAYTLPPAEASGGAVPAPSNGAESNPDFNPDATRVSVVPDELLRASARPSGEVPVVSAPIKPVAAPPPPRVSGVMAPLGDEQHFQDVYRDFIATREKCGEPGDGLTFEKFAGKLRKNREQLIQKYSCRTVRFQVYVKEGKAALKATPVKD